MSSSTVTATSSSGGMPNSLATSVPARRSSHNAPGPISGSSATNHQNRYSDSQLPSTLPSQQRKDSKWEILTSLEQGATYNLKPEAYADFLTKRRKWPLKGWYKRYFLLEKGVLTYGKSPEELKRGRTHGKINLGEAVISFKTEGLRIDINDEVVIHHLKAPDDTRFFLWKEKLKQHTYFKQDQQAKNGSGSAGTGTLSPEAVSPRSSLQRGLRGPGGLVAPGPGGGANAVNCRSLKELENMDQRMTDQLVSIQQHAVSLGLLAQKFEDEAMIIHSNSSHQTTKQKLFGRNPLRKKKVQMAVVSPGSTLQKDSDVGLGGGGSISPQPPHDPATDTEEMPANFQGQFVRPTSLPEAALSNINSYGAGSPVFVGKHMHHMPLSGKNSVTSTLSYGGESVSPNQPHPPPSTSSAVSTLSTTSTLCQSVGNNNGGGPPTRDELISVLQDLQSEISHLSQSYSADREKLKDYIEKDIVQSQKFQQRTATLGSSAPSSMAYYQTLRSNLSLAMQQNAQLREKLGRIYAEAADLPAPIQMPPSAAPPGHADSLMRGAVAPNALAASLAGTLGHQTMSFSSESEFWDAEEYNTADDASSTSSSDMDDRDMEDLEVDDDGACNMDRRDNFEDGDGSVTEEDSEDDSETGDDFAEAEGNEVDPSSTKALEDPDPEASVNAATSSAVPEEVALKSASMRRRMLGTGRRHQLPAISPTSTGLNLWNLLCKNIGKDLSKISMPVTLNEPLSVLQRLCEELEYSELLDKAASSDFGLDRMKWVAAFAVSAYGYCNDRAGHKPFNPLLGETFECVRDDKGFKYIAEQVSHHPPITACHAQSERWTWWQDFRVKTKFWGKSMEFQPEGSVSVELHLKDSPWNEVYTWNKVTTCIHNLFSGSDRWADLYGECVIKCRKKWKETSTPAAASAPSAKKERPLSVCQIEFLSGAGSYWSSASKRHEVRGTIKDDKGKVVQNIFGKCTEALYCGDGLSSRLIWRPCTLPEDNAVFYGFSRFAVELNEVSSNERGLLPPTDTRFRPDQRCLEEGKIVEAEALKLKLEQAQRERRQLNEESGQIHRPVWFTRHSDSTERAAGSSLSSSSSTDQWRFNGDYWNIRKETGFCSETDDDNVIPKFIALW